MVRRWLGAHCLVSAGVLLASVPVRAEAPLRVELEAGKSKAMGNLISPICDDPNVAVMSAQGDGLIEAVGPGTTLCSGLTPVGLRQVYEVVVTGTAPVKKPVAPEPPKDPRKNARPQRMK